LLQRSFRDRDDSGGIDPRGLAPENARRAAGADTICIRALPETGYSKDIAWDVFGGLVRPWHRPRRNNCAHTLLKN
jgi:hypothetical protein